MSDHWAGKLDVRDIQERWIDRKEEYDEAERKAWEDEAKEATANARDRAASSVVIPDQTDDSTEMDTDVSAASLLAPPVMAPRRLGSPFSGKLSSFSFPGRISRPREVPRAFATINHISGRQKTPRTPVPRRALEEKLRDLCRKARRRSRSPSRQ